MGHTHLLQLDQRGGAGVGVQLDALGVEVEEERGVEGVAVQQLSSQLHVFACEARQGGQRVVVDRLERSLVLLQLLRYFAAKNGHLWLGPLEVLWGERVREEVEVAVVRLAVVNNDLRRSCNSTETGVFRIPRFL